MFFIVNKTKRNITLGDLGVNLGPRQAIDLDKARIPRSKSEASKSLKMAQKSGDVEVRFKDKPKSRITPLIIEKINPNPQVSNNKGTTISGRNIICQLGTNPYIPNNRKITPI